MYDEIIGVWIEVGYFGVFCVYDCFYYYFDYGNYCDCDCGYVYCRSYFGDFVGFVSCFGFEVEVVEVEVFVCF